MSLVSCRSYKEVLRSRDVIGGLTRFQNNGFLCPFDVMSSFGMSAAGDICLYPSNISHVTCLLSCIEYPCSSASEATVTV